MLPEWLNYSYGSAFLAFSVRAMSVEKGSTDRAMVLMQETGKSNWKALGGSWEVRMVKAELCFIIEYIASPRKPKVWILSRFINFEVAFLDPIHFNYRINVGFTKQ